MSQDLLQEYRAKKLEEEFYARSTFPRACELSIKHGKARTTYWGKPEVLAESSKEIEGQKMTLISVLWKTKKDLPAAFTLILPAGMKLENVMTPCQYMETDRGYKVVISTVIAGLVMLNIVNFWMAMTLTEVGAEAFMSPFFLVPLSGVIGAVIATLRFNQTHFTHRLSVECYEPDKELGMCHLCYAVDCDLPVHKQLWFVNMPELVTATLVGHQEILNEVFLDTRSAVGMANAKIDDILRNHRGEAIIEANRRPATAPKDDLWGNPMFIGMLVLTLVAIGAAVYSYMGG